MKSPEEKKAARRARNLRYAERVRTGKIPTPPSLQQPEERTADDYSYSGHRPAPPEPRRSGGGGDGRILGVLGAARPADAARLGSLPAILYRPGEPSEAYTYEDFLDRKQRERENPPEQTCTVVTPAGEYGFFASERRDLQRVADLVIEDLDLPQSRRNDVLATLASIPEGVRFQFEEETAT